MAVNWKQIMIMRLKGVSQDRVAGAARCSKRDVARASRVIREHGVTMETLMVYFVKSVLVVPEFLRTLVFARPRGDDQFADCTFSPSLDMSR